MGYVKLYCDSFGDTVISIDADIQIYEPESITLVTLGRYFAHEGVRVATILTMEENKSDRVNLEYQFERWCSHLLISRFGHMIRLHLKSKGKWKE
ncbi:hypothetical protein AKO1_013975 [Acrasis kona]|uniref:Glycosyltransferase 2-like domain-containing protein n=1 Tax=Acrasis kona TaxID=1008807 RepID=A0AAW2Z427_9EUKA